MKFTERYLALLILPVLSVCYSATLLADAHADYLSKEYEISAQYLDGNNNVWKIDCISDADDGICAVTYHPVQPHESSSGVYSGGEAYTLKKYGDAAQNIVTLIEALLNDKLNHGSVRRKGTALLVIGEPEEAKVILNRTPLVEKFENFLGELPGTDSPTECCYAI